MHLLGKAIDRFSVTSKKSLSLFNPSRVMVDRFIIARKRKFDKGWRYHQLANSRSNRKHSYKTSTSDTALTSSQSALSASSTLDVTTFPFLSLPMVMSKINVKKNGKDTDKVGTSSSVGSQSVKIPSTSPFMPTPESAWDELGNNY